MKLPSAEEYLQIVGEKAPGTLATLHHYRFLRDKEGTLLYEKSRHAIVFKAEYNSKLYAIRFFLNDDQELFSRYGEIQNYLGSRPLLWKVDFEFLHQEYYPVIRMDWVEGLSFSDYLDSIIKDPSLIAQLQSKLISLSRDLEKNGIAHGNLNMKHIRFVKQGPDSVLKLIDYDSMFIPSFREKDSFTAGTSSFQHPMRLASDFSETIDRFSIWIFLAALEAIKTDASLWTNATEYGYDKLRQILFNYRDLAIPQQSRAFQIIRSYNNEALNFFADKIAAFCTAKSLDAIEAPQLYSSKSSSFIRRNEKPLPETRITTPEAEQKKPEQIPANYTAAPEPKMQVPEPRIVIPQPKIAIPEPKTTLREIKEGTVEKKEKPVDEKKFVELKIPEKQPEEKFIPVKRKKRSLLTVFVPIVILLGFASVYFIKSQNHPEKISTGTPNVPKKENIQGKIQQPISKESVFTETNLTQFLFGLYQSYNKRDLSSILSNYAESLNQYYDAGGITKNKLSDVIKNLFIKPAYYECHPDIRTLQSNVQGDSCKLSIAVTETIKADRRSKKENYSSKIEYIVDRSFKIVSERNID